MGTVSCDSAIRWSDLPDASRPIIIVPEDVTKARCQHIVLDAGHISVESELVDKADVENIRTKQKEQYSEADFERLESLMYDRYHIKLEAAQLLMANTLEDCMEALNAESSPQVHILERINLAFKAETCIVATAPNLTRFRILGDLPDLHIHFSDRKYKNLMRMIDVALPKFDEAANAQAALQGKATLQDAKSTAGAAPTFRTAPLYLDHDDAISLGEETDIEYEDEEHAAHDKPITRSKSMDVGKDEGDEKFYDADDIVEGVSLIIIRSWTGTNIENYARTPTSDRNRSNSISPSRNCKHQYTSLTHRSTSPTSCSLIPFWKVSASNLLFAHMTCKLGSSCTVSLLTTRWSRKNRNSPRSSRRTLTTAIARARTW